MELVPRTWVDCANRVKALCENCESSDVDIEGGSVCPRGLWSTGNTVEAKEMGLEAAFQYISTLQL